MNKFLVKFRHLNRIVPLCKAQWVAVAMTLLIFSSYWIEAILKIKSIQFQTKRNWRMLLSLFACWRSYFKNSEAEALWCWGAGTASQCDYVREFLYSWRSERKWHSFLSMRKVWDQKRLMLEGCCWQLRCYVSTCMVYTVQCFKSSPTSKEIK